jgi:alpha-beta hydrolase superfamily lysophospholipase
MGHSMGAAIATLYVLERKPDIRGLVLSAPALKPGADLSGALIAVTKVLGTIAPTLAVMDLDANLFSRDPKVVADMERDPLIYEGKGPARTAAELLRAMAAIGERMEEVTPPLLVLHGSADRITNPEGSKELVRRARSKDKTLIIYEGYYHDLLHEPPPRHPAADLRDWLEARAPR